MIPGTKCSVTHKTITKSTTSYGGSNDSLSAGTTFKAVLTAVRGNEGLMYSKETVSGDYVLYSKSVPSTVKEFDLIFYGTRQFRILFVNQPFQKKRFYKLDLLEVK